MIVDNIIFHDKLQAYFNDEFSLSDTVAKEDFPLLICDDYKGKQEVLRFDDVKFRVHGDGSGWSVDQLGVVDKEVINTTHKALSYFGITSSAPTCRHTAMRMVYNELQNASNFTVIDEEVFQFFDCYPYAPVHNLDDTYNLLYQYKKNGLTCKLLVLKSDNFYYNQTLNSLKEYFDLEYIYLDVGVNYLFKKFACTRQYHWIQDDALDFLKREYLQKICDRLAGRQTHDNLSIVKTEHATNCSKLDTFAMTRGYQDLLKQKSIFNIDDLRDDLEYKIYVINNATNIIASYLSPFNVNIHKHCIDTRNKNLIVLNGGQDKVFSKHFVQTGNGEYDFYGVPINGVVVAEKISLDAINKYLNF